MAADFHAEVHLFQELSFQAVARAFTKFQPAAGKFGVFFSVDHFIAEQYTIVVYENAVNSYIEWE